VTGTLFVNTSMYYVFTKNKIMKKISQYYARIVAVLLFNLAALVSFAQEKGIDVDINVKKESEWYQQPWVWIVGAAVFILLLTAILRGGGKRTAE
jgi:hypothetical protein